MKEKKAATRQARSRCRKTGWKEKSAIIEHNRIRKRGGGRKYVTMAANPWKEHLSGRLKALYNQRQRVKRQALEETIAGICEYYGACGTGLPFSPAYRKGI
jgi:hypothetical protein